MSRSTTERRQAILDYINRHGAADVEDLAALCSTSEVTIRKDLTHLETRGLLLRRYGGAVSVPQDSHASAELLQHASVRKQSIARAAAALVQDNSRIIIDAGRTTSYLLPELLDKSKLVIMTNSLMVAEAVTRMANEPMLLMTGGTWDAQSGSFQGQLAERVVRAYDFDQLFVGADGLDAERGTTTFNELYNLSQVMAESARQVIVMAESNKVGRKMHNLELPWSEIDILVTDDRLDARFQAKVEAAGVQVIKSPTTEE